MSENKPSVLISMPTQPFTMARSFKACANGKIYIGKVDTDPMNPANQLPVYIENECCHLVEVAQPISINSGGFPVWMGQIQKFLTTENHSMVVNDAYGATQFYFPNVKKEDPNQILANLGSGEDGKGDALIAVKQPFVGAIARTQHDKNTEWVTFEDFGAVGNGIADDTVAIDMALQSGKCIRVLSKQYVYKKVLRLSGHTLVGAARSESLGEINSAIIFDHDSDVDFSVIFGERSGRVDNIFFTMSEDCWTGNNKPGNRRVYSHGLKLERAGWLSNGVAFNNFTRSGAVFYATIVETQNPYNSLFMSCLFEMNGEHNIVFGGDGNTVSLINCMGRWAGAKSFRTPPTEPGDYDGIIFDGKDPQYITGGFHAFTPQGDIIIGGNYSYASRYGVNCKYVSDLEIVNPYIEGSISGRDINFENIVGSVVNVMAASPISLSNIVQQDPDTPSRNLTFYPNSISRRGRSYGSGRAVFGDLLDARLSLEQTSSLSTTNPSDRNTAVGFDRAGNLVIDADSVGGSSRYGSNVPNIQYNSTVQQISNSGTHRFSRRGVASGDVVLSIGTTGSDVNFYAVGSSNGNSSESALRIPKSGNTDRSINAGGTINAAGADYAEYLYKSDDCAVIKPGQICGINSSGKLTDKFSESVHFCIKSTNPSMVGGDIWHELAGDEPVYPGEDCTQDDLLNYKKEMSDYKQKVELVREMVDRIAFCGVVPVLIDYECSVGDFIIPCRGDNDAIISKCVSGTDITLSDFMVRVGKVIKKQNGIIEVIVNM